jgi:hypothetical protein
MKPTTLARAALTATALVVTYFRFKIGSITTDDYMAILALTVILLVIIGIIESKNRLSK